MLPKTPERVFRTTRLKTTAKICAKYRLQEFGNNQLIKTNQHDREKAKNL
jgi:hypothetical protein